MALAVCARRICRSPDRRDPRRTKKGPRPLPEVPSRLRGIHKLAMTTRTPCPVTTARNIRPPPALPPRRPPPPLPPRITHSPCTTERERDTLPLLKGFPAVVTTRTVCPRERERPWSILTPLEGTARSDTAGDRQQLRSAHASH